MKINKSIIILVLLLVVYVLLYLIKNKEHLKDGAPLGGKCRVATDCANFGGVEKIVCCTASGFDNPITDFGVCTKPCINGGIGWCPKTAQEKSLDCKKNINDNCNQDRDCLGWGNNNKNVRCVNGKCTVSSYNDSNYIPNSEYLPSNETSKTGVFDFDSQTDTPNKKSILYPTRKLDMECRKYGLFGSFMPRACPKKKNDDKTVLCNKVDKNGICLDRTKNCKCIDKNGVCKMCYDNISLYDNIG